VLVDYFEEREPIRYRDPGIAHPNVEIALVLLIGLLRKLCALGSHPPRVVGLGSHHLPSVADDFINRSYAAPARRLSDQRLSASYFCVTVFVLASRRTVERNSALRLAGRTGDEIMPRYFFHLSFGQRTVPDEEGVELPNRAAARDEALAAVRDLANPEHRGHSRRWASWFLDVADETGDFFRTPIGHPALEVVTPETNTRRVEQPDPEPLWPAPIGPLSHFGTREIVRQMAARREMTVQLLKDNQQLRRELSFIRLACEGIRVRADRLISLARAAGARY
jgi:hypothetical protein